MYIFVNNDSFVYSFVIDIVFGCEVNCVVVCGRKFLNIVYFFVYVIVFWKILVVSYVSIICDRGVKEYVVFFGKYFFCRFEIVFGVFIDKIC